MNLIRVSFNEDKLFLFKLIIHFRVFLWNEELKSINRINNQECKHKNWFRSWHIRTSTLKSHLWQALFLSGYQFQQYFRQILIYQGHSTQIVRIVFLLDVVGIKTLYTLASFWISVSHTTKKMLVCCNSITTEVSNDKIIK